MTFTNKWFQMTGIRNFEKYILPMQPLNCLEIGSYEGQSALWLLQNLPQSKLTCVDTFKGSAEHNVNNLYDRFIENVWRYKDRLKIEIGKSSDILPTLTGTYDFIYIDGSHEYEDVLNDGILSYPLLRQGGLIIFDDYTWRTEPKLAINEFVRIHKVEVLEVNEQVVLKKL